MFGHAFLQCTTDEATHGLLHERLSIPAEERNTMREGAAGCPFSIYWLADIRYDAFGHLRFFGLEADLPALIGSADGNAPEALACGFARSLAEAFGEKLAERLPSLGDWDCNTLQYAAGLDEAGVLLLPESIMARAQWPAIIESGRHAGPAFTLDCFRNGRSAVLVATCRRAKLNTLLGIRGLDRRPLFQLLDGRIVQDVLIAAVKKHTGGAAAGILAHMT